MTNDVLVTPGLEAYEKPAGKTGGVNGPINGDMTFMCRRS